MRFYVTGLCVTNKCFYTNNGAVYFENESEYILNLINVKTNEYYCLTLLERGYCDRCDHCSCKGTKGIGYLEHDYVHENSLTHYPIKENEIIVLSIKKTNDDTYYGDTYCDKFHSCTDQIYDCKNEFFDFSEDEYDERGFVKMNMDAFEKIE